MRTEYHTCFHTLYDEKKFLSPGPFVEVLSLSISRLVRSILQEGQSRYLPLWWNSSYRSWFRGVFSFVWDTLLLIFFFHLQIWDLPFSCLYEYERPKHPACLYFLSSSRVADLWLRFVVDKCECGSTFERIAFHHLSKKHLDCGLASIYVLIIIYVSSLF